MSSVLVSGDADDRHLIDPGLVDIGADGLPKFKVGQCRQCKARSFPVAAVCANCLSEDIEMVLVAGDGELYAYSVVHQAPSGWLVPYALGYVDLPEGLRILGHLDADFTALRSGLAVSLSLGEVRRGLEDQPIHSYVFKPT